MVGSRRRQDRRVVRWPPCSCHGGGQGDPRGSAPVEGLAAQVEEGVPPLARLASWASVPRRTFATGSRRSPRPKDARPPTLSSRPCTTGSRRSAAPTISPTHDPTSIPRRGAGPGRPSVPVRDDRYPEDADPEDRIAEDPIEGPAATAGHQWPQPDVHQPHVGQYFGTAAQRSAGWHWWPGSAHQPQRAQR